MPYLAEGSPETEITDDRACALVDSLVEQLERSRPLRRVLLVPPDYTRAHSWAGPITSRLYEQLHRRAEVLVLPALGTHFPMEPQERAAMFPGVPDHAFRVHDWRRGVETLGQVPAEILSTLSDGRMQEPVTVQVARLLLDREWDAILSIGQLVPHEVIGIANQVKNILVGLGGPDFISKSHWLSALVGMERIMGRAWTPVRALMNEAASRFLTHLPITYVMTVRSTTPDNRLVTRGLFAGAGADAFEPGAELCRQVNLDRLDHAPTKVVVWLDPQEFKSTWLGNKAVYRTRMAIADGGELLILAPGVRQFGEDPAIDGLVRKYGYRGTPATLKAVEQNADLAANLSAAAHLIHGSSEGRFRITYAAGGLTRDEIESVGFAHADLDPLTAHYRPGRLRTGWNRIEGEEFFFVENPALGLWGTPERFGAG